MRLGMIAYRGGRARRTLSTASAKRVSSAWMSDAVLGCAVEWGGTDLHVGDLGDQRQRSRFNEDSEVSDATVWPTA